jgi:two-component system NtrC family sensor kinase
VHRYLDAVNAAAATLASSLDLEAGLAGALEALLAGTEAAAGALWRLDGGARDLSLRVARGFPAVGPPARLTWEESLAAAAADGQGVLRVPDLSRLRDPRGEAVRRAGYRAAACVLLRSRGAVLGSLEIYDPAPGRFGDADLQCLLAVGHLLTLALENAGRLEEERRSRAYLTALEDVTRIGLAGTGPEALSLALLERMVALTGADSGLLYMLSPGGDVLQGVAASGLPPEVLPGAVIPREAGPFVTKWLREGKPTMLWDAAGGARIPELPEAGAGVRSMLSVPLRGRGGTLGVVQVHHRSVHTFTLEGVSLLTLLADRAAAALEGARLVAELQEARTAWENTFHSIADGITIQDRQGRILRVNRALAEAAGMPPEALTGQPCARVVHGLVEGEGCPHAWALTTGEPFVEEVSHPVLGGEFRITTFPLWDAAGLLQGSVHVCRNITKERDLQERLSQAAKLATVGELTAGVVHEVLNPLNIISGRVQILLDRPDLDPAVAQSLRVMTAQVTRLSRIAENLLAFARQRPLRRVRTAVNALVEEAVQAYELLLTEAGLRVERRYAGGLPELSLDRDQMVQVLTNLLSNAKDATPAGGVVTVATGLAVEAEKRWVTIAVADTGAGIPEAQRARLFTPFYTTKEEGKGTGLGLSVSYGLVRGHGGTITVESAVGRGTTFTVVLPVEA